MARVNGPISVFNPGDGIPTDASGGGAGGDSTAAAIATAGAQALAAQQTIQNLQGAATTLPAGSAATVTVSGTGTSKVINIGVPRGADGADGAPGMGYEEGQQLLAQNQTTLDAAQAARSSAASSASDAADAVTLAQQAQAAALEIPDDNVEALVGNPATATAARVAHNTGTIYAANYPSIQAAVDAATEGQTVQLPAGSISESVTVTKNGITLRGAGPQSTVWSAPTGPVLTLGSSTAALVRFELRDVYVLRGPGTSAGHAIEVPFGLAQSTFKRVRVTQQNPGNSLLVCDRTGSNGGGLFDNKFTDCHFIMPDNSTVYGFNIVGDANVASANLWHRCRAQGGGVALFNLETLVTSYCYNNTFDVINFEYADHGGIRLRGCINTAIERVGFFDNGTVAGDLIDVGRTGSGPLSSGTSISSVHRSGGSLTGGAVDVRIGGTSGTTTLTALSAPTAAGYTVDLGTGTGRATVIGCDPTTVTLLNVNPARTVIATATNGIATPALNVAGTPILTGGDDPEGVVTAAPGALYLRTGTLGAAAEIRVYVKDSGTGNTGWRSLNFTRALGNTPLNSAANAINAAGKRAGSMVFNVQQNKPVWSTGSNPTDPWVFADGSTAHTPT